jgi:hypothetical protein
MCCVVPLKSGTSPDDAAEVPRAQQLISERVSAEVSPGSSGRGTYLLASADSRLPPYARTLALGHSIERDAREQLTVKLAKHTLSSPVVSAAAGGAHYVIACRDGVAPPHILITLSQIHDMHHKALRRGSGPSRYQFLGFVLASVVLDSSLKPSSCHGPCEGGCSCGKTAMRRQMSMTSRCYHVLQRNNPEVPTEILFKQRMLCCQVMLQVLCWLGVATYSTRVLPVRLFQCQSRLLYAPCWASVSQLWRRGSTTAWHCLKEGMCIHGVQMSAASWAMEACPQDRRLHD